LSASTSLINIKLLFQSTYFAVPAETQPLMHFWSLAVEEQFYLFYPATLILLRPFGQRRSIVILGVASFALCLMLSWRMPTWAFYLLPTRAWELFAGGWLALRPDPAVRKGHAGWIGLILLLLSFTFITDARPFPGWQAAIPVAATLLIIDATRMPGNLARLLSAKPFTWIGVRSYSLYLWHWPVYSFADYALGRQAWIARLPVKLGLTLMLAVLSYELIEQPLRKRLRKRSARPVAFAGFIAIAAAIGGFGAIVRNTDYLSAEGYHLDRGGFAFGEAGKPRVTVIGDSQAAMYCTALRDDARQHGWHLRLLGAAGTNELPGEPDTRWQTASSWLQQDHPDIAVLAYAWNPKLGAGNALDEALSNLGQMGIRTILVLQPPQPSGTGKARYQPASEQRFEVAEVDRSGRLNSDRLVRQIASRHPGVVVVDPAPLFTNAPGTVQVRRAGESPLYYDADHLSRSGAERVIPIIQKAVEGKPADQNGFHIADTNRRSHVGPGGIPAPVVGRIEIPRQ
jgi:hypothetical protein